MPVEFRLIGTTELFWVVLRTGLDRMARQIDVQVGIFPINVRHPLRSDEHFLAGPPITRVGDYVPDGPALIVNHEVINVTDVSSVAWSEYPVTSFMPRKCDSLI